MATLSQSSHIPLLSQIMILQIGAFVVYHLSLALVFDIRWVRFGLRYDVLATLNWMVSIAALYAPAIVLVWIALRDRQYVLPLIITATATTYVAYYWQYPMITGFLHAVGQFDRFPEFLFTKMPGIDEYPPLS